MNIGIDARMIEHSGIGVRLQNILSGLTEYSQNKYYLFGDPQQLKKFPFSRYFQIIDYQAPVYSLSEFWGHPQMANMDLLDIPHFNIPLRYINKCLVTIHDIIPFVQRQYHSSLAKKLYFFLVMFAIKHFARKVITVSDYTRKDLVEHLDFNKNDLITIPNAVSGKIYRKGSAEKIRQFRKKMHLPADYLLTVGIGKEHKNLVFLLRCLGYLWDSGKFKNTLVIAGSRGKAPDYARAMIEKYKKYIMILPELSAEEFPLVYQSAKVLIYPSLYEGFGFPVLEAQSSGCPVVSSDRSVLPEILLDSALLFNPQSEKDCLMALSRFFNDKKLAAKLVSMGLANAKRFSWEVSVRKIIDIYHAYSAH